MDTEVTFSPSISMIPINVGILNDNLTEGSERFLGALEVITTGTVVEFFPSEEAFATILEDDSKLRTCQGRRKEKGGRKGER